MRAPALSQSTVAIGTPLGASDVGACPRALDTSRFIGVTSVVSAVEFSAVDKR